MKKVTLVLALICLTIISCAKKIDGSSEKNFEKSLQEISKSLDDTKKEEFMKAVQVLMFTGMDLSAAMKGEGTDPTADIRTKIDGMTVEEVINEAAKAKKAFNNKTKNF